VTGSRRLEPREAAVRIASVLREAGYETYFAGGCVRDHLLGLEPADVDIATAALPGEVESLFPKARGVGAHFGVMLVPSGGRMIEVATFRTDGSYHDGRRPVDVSFGSAEADARRRDFTINGLFEDPGSGRIIDFVGGQQDLDSRLLRAIGDPEDRFEEDRLRMLRAVRFAARFSLTIDPATASAVSARAERLGAVSRERVGHELRRMLDHATRGAAAAHLEGLGLDRSVLGTARSAAAGDLRRLVALPPTSGWVDALAAWELDRGTLGDAPESIDPGVERLGASLVLSNQECDELRGILGIRATLLGRWDAMGVAARKRLASDGVFDRAVGLLSAESPARSASIRAEVESLARSGLRPSPWVTGDDLLAAGWPPGPAFRSILDAVYDAQLESRVTSRSEALELASRLASGDAADRA
jgi:poly(A) polymerase